VSGVMIYDKICLNIKKEVNKSMANKKDKLVESQILENNFFYNTFQKLSTLWRELTYLVFTMEELKYDVR